MDLQKSMLGVSPMTGLDTHLLVVLAIMIVAGLLGGYANYFLRDRNLEADARDSIRYPVLGVVAALTVPLFLNMISSSLIDGARVRPGDYFVFAGFCLIYVVGSRRIFENVANRLRGQIEQVRREVTQLRKAAEETVPAPVAARLAEVAESPTARAEPNRDAINYNDVEILRALAEENYVYGNLAAIADKTGLARESISQRLSMLKNSGVIETRINDKNILHWVVSPKGKQALAEILGTQEEKRTA